MLVKVSSRRQKKNCCTRIECVWRRFACLPSDKRYTMPHAVVLTLRTQSSSPEKKVQSVVTSVEGWRTAWTPTHLLCIHPPRAIHRPLVASLRGDVRVHPLDLKEKLHPVPPRQTTPDNATAAVKHGLPCELHFNAPPACIAQS